MFNPCYAGILLLPAWRRGGSVPSNTLLDPSRVPTFCAR